MPDRLFYALIATLAGGLIYLGMAPFSRAMPTGSMSSGGIEKPMVEVKGLDLNRFLPGLQDKITLNNAQGAEPSLTIRSAPDDYATALAQDGAHIRLAADLELFYGGRDVSVQIEARALQPDATRLRAIYSTGNAGASPWHQFALTPEYQTFQFDYSVPKPITELGVDYLGLRGDAGTGANAIEIRRVAFILKPRP